MLMKQQSVASRLLLRQNSINTLRKYRALIGGLFLLYGLWLASWLAVASLVPALCASLLCLFTLRLLLVVCLQAVAPGPLTHLLIGLVLAQPLRQDADDVEAFAALHRHIDYPAIDTLWLRTQVQRHVPVMFF